MIAFAKRISVLGGVAALSVLGVLGDVSAQRGAPAAGETGTETGAENEKPMTREEKRAWVEQKTADAYKIHSRVRSMLEQARKEKDTIKIACLTDKLTQIEVNLEGLEDRRPAFNEALAGGDEAGAEHQLTLLRIYVSRIENLMAEAESCVGEGDVVVGESENSVTIDDDITLEDPTEPVDIGIGIDQPIQASAFY
jgi:hypothetical protein